ncbi:MAG: sulfatase-like hydrolase/transferase, partial [Myxococcota bacterium]
PGPTTTPDGKLHLGALTFADRLPTNLLFVTLDTTRRDAIGRYAGNGDTPNLDAVLAESFVLDDHRSCSNWTGPAMTCLMSGRNPMDNGFWPWADDPEVRNFPPDSYRTLASHLTDAGWATTVVTANEIYSSDYGIDAGFAREVREDWVPGPWVVESGLAEVDTLLAGAAPWFLQVHFIDPHGNYCAPEEYIDGEALPADFEYTPDDLCDGDEYFPDHDFESQPEPWQSDLVATYRELYAGEVRYWDDSFGDLWAALEERGALDDTLVVFVTDHGQQFFEHGGHGHGLYLGSEENRSTAAFWATNLEPGSFTEPTIHQDITETLFEAYGIVPLLPTTGLLIGTAPPDRALRAMNYKSFADGPHLSIVKNDRQLLYDWWGGKDLYRLDTDPGALVDVYDPTDPDVIDLWTDMNAWIDDVRATWTHLEEPTYAWP